MEYSSSGDALQACRRADVEVFASRALETRCRRAAVDAGVRELWRRCVGRRGGIEIGSSRGALQMCERYGILELWRCAAGVQTWRQDFRELWRRAVGRRGGMEIGSSRGGLQVCERYGVLELWRCAAGVQTWRYGARELWRRTAGVGTSRYGDRELWRRAAGVGTRRSLPQELWRCALQACRRGDVEVWSSSLSLEFLAFVRQRSLAKHLRSSEFLGCFPSAANTSKWVVPPLTSAP